MGFRTYAIAILFATASLVLAVAAFNVVIDPYGLFDLVRVEGVNEKKALAYTHKRLAKQVRAERLQPKTVLLGNSRIDVGFDPQSERWPAIMRPVANIGIPGDGMDKVETSYAFATQYLHPTTIFIGLDFFDFLSAAPPLAESRLSVEPEIGAAVLAHLPETVFSITALLDSGKTLLAQHNQFSTEMTPNGFNTMQNYVGEVRQVGQWAMVDFKNRQHAEYLRNRAAAITQANGQAAAPMVHLRNIMADAANRGQRVILFTYPMHGHFYAMLFKSGHWDLLEEWKRTLLAEWQAVRATAPDWETEFWDFAQLTDQTTEAAPLPGQRSQTMQWYWETGHFKAKLGDRLISIMTGDAGEGFGVRLGLQTIDAHLHAQRQTLEAYRRSNPGDFAYISELCDQLGCSPRE
jgi:hypothetical protein